MNNVAFAKKVDDRAKEVILSGSKVSKYFGGLAALSEVDFTLYKNEILGLIGPNGAGKTTLFNLIAGVYKPDKGFICLREEKINGLRPDKICRKGIARTFQIPKPFIEMNVLENIMIGSYFGSLGKKSLKECKEKAEEVLLRVGLVNKRKVLGSQLTLVERKRLEFARALATDPIILMLDEVIAGLNPAEAMNIVELINMIRNEGISIFMIEHVMKAVMNVSDRIMVLHYGKKIAEGKPTDIASNKEVIEAYLGRMVHAQTQKS